MRLHFCHARSLYFLHDMVEIGLDTQLHLTQTRVSGSLLKLQPPGPSYPSAYLLLFSHKVLLAGIKIRSKLWTSINQSFQNNFSDCFKCSISTPGLSHLLCSIEKKHEHYWAPTPVTFKLLILLLNFLPLYATNCFIFFPYVTHLKMFWHFLLLPQTSNYSWHKASPVLSLILA